MFGPGFGEVGFGLTRLRLWVGWAGSWNCFWVWPVLGSDSELIAFSRLDLMEASLMVVDKQFRLDGGCQAVSMVSGSVEALLMGS